MTLTIGDDKMVCDVTPHVARRLGDYDWEVSWLPAGMVVDRNAAITAMNIAEVVAGGVVRGDPMWIFVEGWAAELGLEAFEAVALASAPVRHPGSEEGGSGG